MAEQAGPRRPENVLEKGMGGNFNAFNFGNRNKLHYDPIISRYNFYLITLIFVRTFAYFKVIK